MSLGAYTSFPLGPSALGFIIIVGRGLFAVDFKTQIDVGKLKLFPGIVGG
jgi:hypothetical protein